MKVEEATYGHLLAATRCLTFLFAFFLVSSSAEADSDTEVTRLENSLDGLVGQDRLDVIYPWLERNRDVQPQVALTYGQEAIGLLTDEVDRRRVYYFHYWTAEAAWYFGDMEQASSLVSRAVDVARDLGDEKLEHSALLILASADRGRGEPLKAVKHAIRMRETASNPDEEVRALNSLAMAYREMEDLPAALEIYSEALQISMKQPRNETMGTLLANTGRVYFLMGQTAEAIQNTEEALTVLKEFELERDAAYVLYNLGSYRLEAEEFEKAGEHLEEALATLEGMSEEGQVPIYLQSSLAIVAAALGREREARERSGRALAQARERGNEAWLLKARLSDAEVKHRLGDLRAAQQQLESCVSLAESLDRQFQLADGLKQLALVHEELGEPGPALAYLQRSTELRNRLVDEKHQEQFAEWRARLSFAEAEQQLAEAENVKKLQEIELKRQRVQRNSLLSSTVLLVLLCVGVLFSYRRLRGTLLALKEAHGLLKTKREKLEKALSQVNLLSGLLPICAECKSVRDDDGYWQMIESYISDHSEAEFSHGICPDCAQRVYSDLGMKADGRVGSSSARKNVEDHLRAPATGPSGR